MATKTSFRDKLTTVDSKGRRVWVFPKKPKGILTNYRRIVAFLFFAFFFIIPWIKYKGDPFILFNIIERKFIILGAIFWPQDFYLVVMSILTSLVFLVLFTVIFGRIFCGWFCPQTLFMEFLFRPIEYLIDGDRKAQMKLAKQAMNGTKFAKRVLKYFLFSIAGLAIGHTFFAFILSMDTVISFYTEGVLEHLSNVIPIWIFSGMVFFIFGFFREQVCTIACPYGRLQGVLLDNKSILVIYDYLRGEPRKGTKDTKDYGDCHGCMSCVHVCPTNIDIRNGTQLECINCTACIDACDAEQVAVGNPKGLIRFDSEEGVEKKETSIWNTRTIAYSFVLLALIGVLSSMFFLRTDFETTVLRQKGTLFQKISDTEVSNIYEIEIINKTRNTYKIDVNIIEPANGEIRWISSEITIEKGAIGKGRFMIILPTNEIHSHHEVVKLGISCEDKLIKEYDISFLAPRK
jgi:cytochrome c oxidase accessory protein FixG